MNAQNTASAKAAKTFGKFIFWITVGFVLVGLGAHLSHHKFDPGLIISGLGALVGGIGKAAATWWATGKQVAEREIVDTMSQLSKIIQEESDFAKAMGNAIQQGTPQDVAEGAQIAASYVQTTEGLVRMMGNPAQMALIVLESMGIGGKFDPYESLRPQVDAYVAKWLNPQPAPAAATDSVA